MYLSHMATQLLGHMRRSSADLVPVAVVVVQS
jgi:hypothetical protein